MTRKSTRREFLKSKSAADALADLGAGAIPADDAQGAARAPAGQSYLVRISRRAMACDFEVFLNAGQYPQGTEAAIEALDLVERIEDQLSFFRGASEISRVNRSAADGPVAVKPRLFELLELALKLHAETDGAYDVTAGPLSDAWGFSRRRGTVPNNEQLAEALRLVGSHLVELDPRNKTVRFRRPGVQINLGSIGKGHALDRCTEQLVSAGVGDFLIHGGMSSVSARGCSTPGGGQPSEAAPDGWTVGISHPVRKGKRLAEIRLCDRALATSGGGVQWFRHKGQRYGHILDPRSGQPAEGILSATVLAPTATMADALSTAFFVMGPQQALQWCANRAEISTLLVCPGKHPGDVRLESAGLEEGELRMLHRW